MAKKALKSLATANTSTLNRTHSISLGVYTFFIAVRSLLFPRRLLPFFLLSAPAILIELYFERLSRPSYTPDGDVRKTGEDLEAQGLTEWMWDVLYWTWGNVVLVALAGDWAWWLYLVVPAYSAWLAFTTYSGVRKGFAGVGMGGGEGEGMTTGAQSKRAAKMEKRGGQRVQYR